VKVPRLTRCNGVTLRRELSLMSTSHESPSPAGSLRIGDAERVAAATALGDHFAAGRIDQDELDERLAAAYAARTYADIDPLFADLPEPRPARPEPPTPVPAYQPRHSYRRPVPPWAAWVPAVPVPLLVLGTFLIISIIGTVMFFAPFVLLPLVWFWVAGSRGRWRRGGWHRGGCGWR
jgi:hypothetical protein